jgi:hypothetical protein
VGLGVYPAGEVLHADKGDARHELTGTAAHADHEHAIGGPIHLQDTPGSMQRLFHPAMST